MALLSKDQILSAEDRSHVEVEVPEWGGSVRLRSLSGRERDKFEAESVSTTKSGKQVENLDNFRARLVAACAVDEDDNKLFGSKMDVQALGEKSVIALQRVFSEALKLNRMSDEDVEELTEDFGETPDEDSGSD